MCNEFIINGKRINLLGELEELIKDYGEVPYYSFYKNTESFSYKTCLCPVDIQSLSNMLNMKAVSDGLNIYFGDSADKILEEQERWNPQT